METGLGEVNRSPHGKSPVETDSVHTHTHTHAHTRTPARTHIYLSIYLSVYLSIYTHTHISIYLSIYICIYIYNDMYRYLRLYTGSANAGKGSPAARAARTALRYLSTCRKTGSRSLRPLARSAGVRPGSMVPGMSGSRSTCRYGYCERPLRSHSRDNLAHA